METDPRKDRELLAERLNDLEVSADQSSIGEPVVRNGAGEASARSTESISNVYPSINDGSQSHCILSTEIHTTETENKDHCLEHDSDVNSNCDDNSDMKDTSEVKNDSQNNMDIRNANDVNMSKSCDTFVDSQEELVDDESEESGSEDEYESAEEGEELQTDTQILREQEESLTEEEKEEKRKCGQALKEEGNDYFRNGSYKTAIKTYSQALRTCPIKFQKDRAIMYSNRAACKMKLESFESAIKDCSKAVELHPHYLKALMRRAELYEKTEKLDEALADYQKIVEMDPSQHSARAACARLPDMIKERNEKLKEEMMSKLKDLGNMVLRPFGLSTNNFKLNQDPNSGGYSVNFVQNPADGT